LKPRHAEQGRGASGEGAGRRPSPLSGKKIGQLHAGYFFDHTIGGLETPPHRMFLQYKQLGKSFKIMKKFSSVSIDSLETV